MQALSLNDQLRFCTFSIQIHVVKFDPRANLTRTYAEKNTYCTFELLTDIFMKYEGRKTQGKDKYCTFGAGDGGCYSRL